jgi:hypothetical protein
MYESYDMIKQAVTKVSKQIQRIGLPKKLFTPMVIAVTGDGSRARGSLEILKLLPHTIVNAAELRNYLTECKDSRSIVICHLECSEFELFLDVVHFLINTSDFSG